MSAVNVSANPWISQVLSSSNNVSLVFKHVPVWCTAVFTGRWLRLVDWGLLTAVTLLSPEVTVRPDSSQLNTVTLLHMTCAWTEISNKNTTLHRDDFSKRVRDGKREREAGMGEGKRNAHPVIPWFARRQALHSRWARAQWALYRGANQPCQAIACLIKGQERGALSANDWAKNKTHSVFDWEEDFSAQTFFLVVHEKENVNVWPDVWVEGYRGLSSRRSVSPRKVNIRYGDVFRHSGLRKHVSADTMHTNT